MKKIIVALMILVTLVFPSCRQKSDADNKTFLPTVVLDEEKSYFDDFSILDNKVEIWCHIFVQNTTSSSQLVQIQGDFYGDWKSGLLNKRIIVAKDPSTGQTQFNIPPGETRIHLVFCCDYGGGATQKQNRLLPQITIKTAVPDGSLS